jgi:hypothetical protein
MDIETRRKKQQALMVRLVERQVRSRAQQLYETRGPGDGRDLQDWFQAEAEVLDKNVIAPLYFRMQVGPPRMEESVEKMPDMSPEISSTESLASSGFASARAECETVA